MKTLEEWKALLDQANERRMPLYVTPEELRELRDLEYQRTLAYLGNPDRKSPDWIQLLGLTGTEVVVDRFAVERRMGMDYQNLVEALAKSEPWISGATIRICKFCNSSLVRERPREGELSEPQHHQATCVWRRAVELIAGRAG